MIIHLIAAGKMENPSNWSEICHRCYNVWKSSPYEIKIWNGKDIDNLLKEDDENFFNNFLSNLDPIYKWDYVRYIILGKYGGAYFDLDVELKFDFISMLHPEKVYIAEGEDNSLVSNHILISPPDYEYWYNIRQQAKYRLINRYEKAKESEYWTLETVGPIGLSYILSKNKYKFTPLSRWHFGNDNTNLQFCVHHSMHKWTEGKLPPFQIYFNYK